MTGMLASVVMVVLLAAGSAQAQAFSVLYSFTGNTDGAFPSTTMSIDAAGNLYGTTIEGSQLTCTGLCGNIFKVTPTGKETSLHTFAGGVEGYDPSGVVLDKSGDLYGSVADGGPKGDGFVFKLSSTGKGTLLHAFPANPEDGETPGGLLLDPAGNVYGIAPIGGDGGCNYGCGLVFRLSPSGQEATLHFNTFMYEPGSLTRDTAGNLYGATPWGSGTGCDGIGCGSVFKIDTSGTLTVLYTFLGAPDGGEPWGSVAVDSAGNVYGATVEGGNSAACPPSGCGTVYKVDPTGKETQLLKFSDLDGALPEGGVILDSKGNLYGTTYAGGTHNYGTVYKIDTTGQQTVLYNFTGATDGHSPLAGLTLDSAGNLYGTAFWGGFTGGDGLCFPGGCGTVFKITQ